MITQDKTVKLLELYLICPQSLATLVKVHVPFDCYDGLLPVIVPCVLLIVLISNHATSTRHLISGA